ncbi:MULTISPECIES: hypothetical protein [unclassified Moraxella]|uniref:hypothetical protein n=1 Tax=unclassified Moraxella TaxID=2685852 RepID=UPI003AF92A0B
MLAYHNDPLYYPRTALAQLLVDNLSMGISSAFTLFAPRRMGKTQFLLNDVRAVAKDAGFNVFYFSFMSEQQQAIHSDFTQALQQFAHDIMPSKTLKAIKSVEVFGVGFER